MAAHLTPQRAANEYANFMKRTWQAIVLGMHFVVLIGFGWLIWLCWTTPKLFEAIKDVVGNVLTVCLGLFLAWKVLESFEKSLQDFWRLIRHK